MAKTGRTAVLDYATNKIIAEIKKQISDLGQFACAKTNKVIAELKSKGAKVPDTSKWSCDQKIAFVAALGPYGVECLIAGTIVAGMASNVVETVEKYGKDAEKSAQSVANKAAKAASDAVSSIGHKLGL